MSLTAILLMMQTAAAQDDFGKKLPKKVALDTDVVALAQRVLAGKEIYTTNPNGGFYCRDITFNLQLYTVCLSDINNDGKPSKEDNLSIQSIQYSNYITNVNDEGLNGMVNSSMDYFIKIENNQPVIVFSHYVFNYYDIPPTPQQQADDAYKALVNDLSAAGK